MSHTQKAYFCKLIYSHNVDHWVFSNCRNRTELFCGKKRCECPHGVCLSKEQSTFIENKQLFIKEFLENKNTVNFRGVTLNQDTENIKEKIKEFFWNLTR